ncbi:MAG: FecR family protein [Kiritimatiellia bacterium]
MNRVEELVHKCLDEQLTCAEAEELAALLERRDAEAQAALQLLQIEGLLRGELVQCDVAKSVVEMLLEEAARRTAKNVLQKIDDKRLGEYHTTDIFRRSAVRSFSRWGLTVAAAFAILAGGYFVWRWQSAAESKLRLAEIPPPPELPTPPSPTEQGGVEYFATQEESGQRINLEGIGEIELGADTLLALVRRDNDFRIELHHGHIFATVQSLPPGCMLAVSTPRIVVEVVGTRFEVEHQDEISRVKVEEGQVEVIFEAEGQRVTLHASQELITPAEKEPEQTRSGTLERNPLCHPLNPNPARRPRQTLLEPQWVMEQATSVSLTGVPSGGPIRTATARLMILPLQG